MLLGFLLASAPMPARAASVLSNGSVSPGSGTTATAFSFSVDYNSSNPVRNALSVWAEAGGVTVPLALVAGGNTHAGTWQGSSIASGRQPGRSRSTRRPPPTRNPCRLTDRS